jgi:hypothetical protein
MLAARAFMMLFCITQQPVQGVASSCKIPSALSTADTASNSCIPFTAMLILAKLKQPLLYILHVKYR